MTDLEIADKLEALIAAFEKAPHGIVPIGESEEDVAILKFVLENKIDIIAALRRAGANDR